MKTAIILLITFLVSVVCQAQEHPKTVTISGIIKDASKAGVPFANVQLTKPTDSTVVAGTVSDENGRFTLAGITPGNYKITLSFVGYKTKTQPLYVGSLSDFLDLSVIEMEEEANALNEVVVVSKQDDINAKMDKKTFSVADNISQSGGSVLQTMQNLPGVTVQDGKVQLRGNDKVMVLVDGKQTAITGFGNQSGLIIFRHRQSKKLKL